jgi:hypothetical protein
MFGFWRQASATTVLSCFLLVALLQSPFLQAIAQSNGENINSDYVTNYYDLDIPTVLDSTGFDGGEGFGALDWSDDEKHVLIFNTNRRTEVTSLLVIKPFEGNETLLDYSFTSSDVLTGIGQSKATSQIVNAKFSPNDANVVYLVMKYQSQERNTGIYKFNQTDRSVSTIYTVPDVGTYLQFDFASDPNSLFVWGSNKGLFSLDLTDNSTRFISGGSLRAFQDVSDDGKKLLWIEYPDMLVVYDLTRNITTHYLKAYTGQPHERLRLSQAHWATDDYVIYSAGIENPEPRAPFEPVILAVQSIGSAEPVSYELIRWPFRVGNVMLDSDATSILVDGEGYGQYDVFRLELARAIPEFPFPVLGALAAISLLVLAYYRFRGNVTTTRV